MLSLFHRLSQIRQNDCFKFFKGLRNAVLSFYNTTLGTTRSNRAILAALCFLWWILQHDYYLTVGSLLFHYMPSLPSPFIGRCWILLMFCPCCMVYELHLLPHLAQSLMALQECQWPMTTWPLRWRQLCNVAMTLPAHRRLVYSTTSVQGLDSEMFGVII